jgi:uncharacterized protein
MKMTFSSEITAADTETRTITGLIVPFGATGNTSAGAVVFEPGSISIRAGKTKLFADHDNRQVLGSMISHEITTAGIMASFKIANTTAGNDALELAASGLKSGLSVGVDVKASKPSDGVMYVSQSDLQEVSLVESAAFESAAVYSVAASETDPEETPTNESEASMSEATPEVEPEVVEASRTRVPVAYTEARTPIIDSGTYLQHTIRATMGNDESALYVRAADAKAQRLYAANDSFTTNPAFTPVQYVSQVIDTSVMTRPTIDALGGARPLSPSGMTIAHPKITTNATIGTVAEGASTASTQIVSSYVNATVVKLAGTQIMSTELLDRSDPSFFTAMMENCTRAYAKASDAAVIAEIVSGGTQASTQAATIAGIQAYVAQAAPAVYAAAGEVGNSFIAGTSVWSLLIGSLDTTGRSIFNAAQPQNANGQSSPRGLRGDVMGLDLWVDANMVSTTIDDCAFITTPSAIAIYESPQLTLSVNVVATGEISVLLYGYFATKTLVAGGLQRFNLT